MFGTSGTCSYYFNCFYLTAILEAQRGSISSRNELCDVGPRPQLLWRAQAPLATTKQHSEVYVVDDEIKYYY